MPEEDIFAEPKEPVFKERWREHEIICPYCGHEFSDSYECAHRECFEEECPECEKKFHVNVITEVFFTSTPDCKRNGQEHKFTEESQRDFHNRISYHRKCLVCDHYECRLKGDPEFDD